MTAMDTTKILTALATARPDDLTVVAKDGRFCIQEIDGARAVTVTADSSIDELIVEGNVYEPAKVRGEVPWNDDEADAAQLILQSLEDTVYAVKRHAGTTNGGRLATVVWDDLELTNDDGTLAYSYAVVSY